jgi:dipeptidyl-peptidase III
MKRLTLPIVAGLIAWSLAATAHAQTPTDHDRERAKLLEKVEAMERQNPGRGEPPIETLAERVKLLEAEFERKRAAVPEKAQSPKKYLLERVEDVAVVQLYADGFTDLPLKEKLLVWHLYQAGVAGRDIYYDQRYRHSLLMRTLLEAVITQPKGIEPHTLAEVQHYAKLFWINSGPFNHMTARKFVMKCSPKAFEDAVKTAVRNGAELGRWNRISVDELLSVVGPSFFDPKFEPVVTNKNPGPGKDILAASANNLYVGVSMKDLQGFSERFGLNSQLVKAANGALVENVYRVGGLYGPAIEKIVTHLEHAKKYAPEPTAKALDALIKFYKTGEDTDRQAADIAWIQDKDAPVDTINGFIEVYLDPRGIKGSWESAVFFFNKEKTGAIKKLAAESQWFEDRMPWDKAFRKANVKGITANAIDVVIETGDCGPVTPIGINLPNDQKIREAYGSKSVSLSNVIEGNAKSMPSSFRSEFAWTPDAVKRAETWSTLASELLVNMHDVIGHASGRQSEKMKGQPQDEIKEFYSALEEGRADLVALYFMADPKLTELGLIPKDKQEALARASYESYATNVLVQLRRVREGSQLEEDHMRNRQMVVHWLIANTKAVEVRKRDGKTYYVMTDAKAFREGVGKLLAEVQRIKSTGDYAAAKSLFETHGIQFDPKLRDEVVDRVKKLGLPSYNAFVMPRLALVKGADGSVTDVTISYPMDLTQQMLEFSAARDGK